MEREFEHRLTEVEERSKSNQHRLDDVENRQNNLDKLAASVAVLAEREKNVEVTVGEIRSDVKSLTEKPSKRWDGIVTQIIGLIVAAVIGAILVKIGL